MLKDIYSLIICDQLYIIHENIYLFIYYINKKIFVNKMNTHENIQFCLFVHHTCFRGTKSVCKKTRTHEITNST